MKTELEINSRFCGPPDSGNGGYSCGVIANHLGRSAKVRLEAPPPLNIPLKIVRTSDGVELRNGETIIGFGCANELNLSVPQAPSLERARHAETRYTGLHGHMFPGCFVCGPDREHGDGLRIFPGPVEPDNWSLLACTWNPTSDLLDAKGNIREEYVWSALDCPSYFGVVGQHLRPALLGEFELSILGDIAGGAPLIVWCWPISMDGRKMYGGSALGTAQGELLAFAKGTWIELKNK